MSKPETKDSFPKIDPLPKIENAAQTLFSAFDPMATWAAAQQTWSKMMSEASGRAQAWADEYAQLETQMYARARSAVDTWAQLARDTIAYGEQLSAQARKLGFEA